MPQDLKYLAVAESSLLIDIRSRKGALGTWQFMAQTARRNGLRKDGTMDERRSFERSTEAALKYLKRLNSVFGTWTLVLAAYNLGETRLKKEIKRQIDIGHECGKFVMSLGSPVTPETPLSRVQEYVKITRRMANLF